MKTFKLKMLKVMYDNKEKEIQLMDGLIINREDDSSPEQWLIEAYISKDYISYFEELKDKDHVKLLVKISKIENDPVEFISTIIGINKIGKDINVLFKGDIHKVNK